MATDPRTTSIEMEAVMANLNSLREDVSRLALSVANTTTQRGQAMAQDAGAAVTDAAQYLGRKGHEVDVRIEKAVADNPYVALGLAAALGLILGAMSRR